MEERKKERQDILTRGIVVGESGSGNSPQSSPLIKGEHGGCQNTITKLVRTM